MELSSGGAPGHVVIGGGVLGLSAAWRLAERGADVLVLEKDRIGGGASGIAGGIVRNYYRSAAISEVIRRSVELFEADPDAFGFRQVGYVAAVPERQVDDLRAIRDHHERVGYESELVVGADGCREYLEWTWPDWDAEVEALLHERRGGWADAMQTVRQLAARARDAGARLAEGVEVTGFELGGEGVQKVATSDGPVPCEAVIAAPGPWAARLWSELGQDGEVAVGRDGERGRRSLFSYLKAQEGEFALPGVGLAGSAGHEAPVVHLDQTGPLVSDRDGRTLVDGPWGIYFRMGRTGTGITGGGLPVALDDPALDPYGPDNPTHAAEPSFGEFFTSGLAAAIRRFRGRSREWSETPAGGIVMHTPDDYPICDRVLPNAYAIVDSGHGFKMLALGRLAADDLLDGGEPLLEPFRLARFERGEAHVASAGPYPWT
jgi:glycine/D-amino acid oxidase-like deaminating enzyme